MNTGERTIGRPAEWFVLAARSGVETSFLIRYNYYFYLIGKYAACNTLEKTIIPMAVYVQSQLLFSLTFYTKLAFVVMPLCCLGLSFVSSTNSFVFKCNAVRDCISTPFQLCSFE